jgi:hypothetical protein
LGAISPKQPFTGGSVVLWTGGPRIYGFDLFSGKLNVFNIQSIHYLCYDLAVTMNLSQGTIFVS